jgi:hypothetical protein
LARARALQYDLIWYDTNDRLGYILIKISKVHDIGCYKTHMLNRII